MSSDLLSSAVITPSTSRGLGASAPEVDRARVKELAQEFESLLILQMIKQMRETFLDETQKEEGFGAETMTETIDVELSRQLARQGGLGLAKSIERGIDGLVTVANGLQPATTSVAGATEAVARPTAADVPVRTASAGDAAGLDLPLPARVSSGFGYRADPFHGARRFHAGMDFAAAYGREVPAAGAGRVVSAGDDGGYGLSVVVDHGDGVRSRYAHLSSVAVTAGQQLARSEVVGRVGQTGRATGPHLHFEVELDGQKVDPATVVHRVPGGLKFPGGGVDSSVEGVPAGVPAVE